MSLVVKRTHGLGAIAGKVPREFCPFASLLELWYCDYVKNITVSLQDDIYRRARVKAAERDTSVSALVRDFLSRLGEEESDSERRKRLQQEVLASLKNFRAGDRVSREKVHER